MNDDLHPDAVDEELRRRFGAGAPTGADPDAVLDAMRPRLQRARTRRRASFASAIAGVAVLVVVLAFALGGNGGDSSVRVPPATKGPVNTVPTTPTTAPAGGVATPDSVPATRSTTAAPTTRHRRLPPTTSRATAPDHERLPTSSRSSRASVLVGTAARSPCASRTAWCRSSSNTPAAGYTADVHDNGPTRVEVRFSNGQTE